MSVCNRSGCSGGRRRRAIVFSKAMRFVGTLPISIVVATGLVVQMVVVVVAVIIVVGHVD